MPYLVCVMECGFTMTHDIGDVMINAGLDFNLSLTNVFRYLYVRKT